MKIIQGQEKVILRAVSPDGATTSGDLLTAFAEDSGSTGIRISNLEVETQTTLNSTTTTIEDSFLEVNRNNSTADSEDSGLFFNRGSENHALLYWDAGDDNFVVGTTTHEATVTAISNITLGQLKVATTPTDANHAASKSYVDSRTITVAGDNSAAITIDFDDAELVLSGGNSITTATTAGGNAFDISVDAAMTGINSITSASSENITLVAQSNLIVIDDFLTFQNNQTDPSAAAISKFYAKTPGAGGTGFFAINSAVDGGEATELLGATSADLKIFGDDSTTMEVNLPTQELHIKGGAGIVTSTSSTQTLTISVSGDISVNNISSPDSTAVVINDGLDVIGTLQVSDIGGHDSTAIQLNEDVNVNGNLRVNTKNIHLGDSGGAFDGNIMFGADNDLQINHDGSNSFIIEGGTGNLEIQTNSQVNITAGGEDVAKFIKDGAVELYHDNVKKIETTSIGVTVTGGITSSGATVMTPVDDLATSTTALSLTASVHSLAVGEADYTLAAGTEGQIMHFVVAGGDSVIGNVANTKVTITQVRDPDDGDVLATYVWSPFIGNQAGDSTTPKRTLATCVFANGAWNLDQYNDIT